MDGWNVRSTVPIIVERRKVAARPCHYVLSLASVTSPSYFRLRVPLLEGTGEKVRRTRDTEISLHPTTTVNNSALEPISHGSWIHFRIVSGGGGVGKEGRAGIFNVVKRKKNRKSRIRPTDRPISDSFAKKLRIRRERGEIIKGEDIINVTPNGGSHASNLSKSIFHFTSRIHREFLFRFHGISISGWEKFEFLWDFFFLFSLSSFSFFFSIKGNDENTKRLSTLVSFHKGERFLR